MIYKLSPRFILVRIKKKLSLMRQLFLLYCRGPPRASPYNGLRAADYGGPYVDEQLFRAENAVAGIA